MTKSADPKTANKKRQAKRTEFLPPGFFLSPYQDKKRPHPATLPARIIKKQFDPKAAALKLLKVLNKAQEDAIAIFKATKAAYLNAKNYDKVELLKSYLEQVISLFRVVQKFLPWKEILAKHSDGWNPYTERKHIKVIKQNKQPTKESTKRDPKKPYKIPKINQSKAQPSGLKPKPYKRKPNKGNNKWKETFRMA
ncbi:hypothetical protein PTTG_09592 [Puccinia triticina 1-1 BBBD Race 1]|uniref:Uncharacterized protein n=1 Tax=Puccinia triticina (isolate 1-1 / race 1 (BBBD)) TaxID=630390 RepID=A0A0C4DFG6_PUCT1|nr:hypothetical protein PTTG_09592 [Puccinia triticina 1-1 BBBD Race 1]